MGVKLNRCTSERVYPSWCVVLPRKDSSATQWRNWSLCMGQDKSYEQTCVRVWSRCFVSPTISYLLLQSKVVITDHPTLCSLLLSSVQCNAILNAITLVIVMGTYDLRTVTIPWSLDQDIQDPEGVSCGDFQHAHLVTDSDLKDSDDRAHNLMEATLGHEQPQSRGTKQSSYPPFITYWKIPPHTLLFSTWSSLDLSLFLASSKNSRTLKQIHKSRSTLMDWSRSTFLQWQRSLWIVGTRCVNFSCEYRGCPQGFVINRSSNRKINQSMTSW